MESHGEETRLVQLTGCPACTAPEREGPWADDSRTLGRRTHLKTTIKELGIIIYKR